MKRAFSFGCSFTKYVYPTWADIVSLHFDEFKNYGKSGAGNFYIYHKLLETFYTDNICDLDTVFIMFSSSPRHDIVDMNNKWNLNGNVYNSNGYFTEDFFNKYWSPLQSMYISWSSIISCISLLNTIGCDYRLMKGFDLTFQENAKELLFDIDNNTYVNIIKQELKSILHGESLFEYTERVGLKPYTIDGRVDLHPTVNIHGGWVKEYLNEYWDDSTERFVKKEHKRACEKYKTKKII
jgi:hypothetical protein